MIKLNTIDAIAIEIMPNLVNSKNIEIDPELFENVLEYFSEPKNHEDSKGTILLEKKDFEEENTINKDEYIAYTNPLFFKFPSIEIPITSIKEVKKDSTLDERVIEHKKTNDIQLSISMPEKVEEVFQVRAPSNQVEQKETIQVVEQVEQDNILQLEKDPSSKDEVFQNDNNVLKSSDINGWRRSTLLSKLDGKPTLEKPINFSVPIGNKFQVDHEVAEKVPVHDENEEMFEERLEVSLQKPDELEKIFPKQKEGTITSIQPDIGNQVIRKVEQTFPTIENQPVVTKTTLAYIQPEQFIKELGETIQVSMVDATKENGQVIQMKVAPESLGNIEIHLKWNGDKVEAKIFVQEKEMKSLLEQQLHQLQSSLLKEGAIQSITVAFMPQETISYQFSQELGQRKTMTEAAKANSSRTKKEKRATQKGSSHKKAHGLSIYM